ncbi:hypothetical protein E2C01_014505 [Portunus trituberculatus]|uniref:Uncharacterized protein n=2 Tax=Pleocyemata TaxID=6692 RepID=A0A5B7DK86_PORTR|nr:hypothetical protein [Portunus trituberculatus]
MSDNADAKPEGEGNEYIKLKVVGQCSGMGHRGKTRRPHLRGQRRRRPAAGQGERGAGARVGRPAQGDARAKPIVSPCPLLGVQVDSLKTQGVLNKKKI